ncbi:MAG: amidohydrolase family protein, partial [Planctomycetota bacterium]
MAFAGEYFRERYGPKITSQAPPLRTLLESGIPLGAGTDATRVSSHNPWLSLYWMVSGKTVGSTELYPKSQRLSRLEALELFTRGSAWLSGEETDKGQLKPGMYADLTVLSKDYFEVPEEEIRSIESVLTVVDGKPVYGAGPYAKLTPPLPKPLPEWSPVTRFGGYYANDSESK